MMSNCTGGMVILTGASSGIGLAMSKTLLSKGYSVTGIARSFDAGIADSENFKAVTLDLSELDELSKKLGNIISEIDVPIRALVHNAGVGKFASVEQLSVPDMKLVMETNF